MSAIEQRRQELALRLPQLAPKAQLDLLLEDEQLLRSLPAPVVFEVIGALGLADAHDLVVKASPTQFRAFVDLACFRGEELDISALAVWLAIGLDDEESWGARFDLLDEELVELFLLRSTKIHELETDPDANPERSYIETPDDRFLVELLLEGEAESALRSVLRALMARDPSGFSERIASTFWAFPSDLSETTIRLHETRLEELGIPKREEALQMVARLPAAKLPARASLQVELAAPVAPELLELSVATLPMPERRVLAAELRRLVAALLVVEGAPFGVREIAERYSALTRGYLSLGLEELAPEGPGQGAEVFRKRSASEVLRVGLTRCLELRERALGKEQALQCEGAWLLFDADLDLLRGLLRRFPVASDARNSPIQTRSELAAATKRFDELVAIAGYLRSALGSDPKDALTLFALPLEVLTAERLGLAITAQAVLEGRLVLSPVPMLALPKLEIALELAATKSKAIAALQASTPDATGVEHLVERAWPLLHADVARDGHPLRLPLIER